MGADLGFSGFSQNRLKAMTWMALLKMDLYYVEEEEHTTTELTPLLSDTDDVSNQFTKYGGQTTVHCCTNNRNAMGGR